MLAQLRNFRIHAIGGMALAATLCGLSALVAQSTDEPSARPDETHERQQSTQELQEGIIRPKDPDGRTALQDETPTLGVRVLPSPGQCVLVTSTIWGSPAHEAGLQPGDFILAVDDTSVATPEELKRVIERSEENARVKLKVWRNEETFTKEVQLARRADAVPASHRAWLGVVLSPAPVHLGQGVAILDVFPNSPADRCGLRPGDVINKVGDEDGSNIDSLVKCLEKHGPGSGCNLTILRNGQLKKVQFQFGDLEQAPAAWLENAFRAPLDASDLQVDSQTEFSDGSDGDLNETIMELRREIAELRDKLRAMESEKQETQQEKTSRAEERPQGGNDASSHSRTDSDRNILAATSPAAALIGQLAVSPTRNGWHERQFYRDRYAPRHRYGYRDYMYGRNPNTGWYYNHNGNNWYYPNYRRGGFYYGPRFGVRVGPGWGVYWY